MRLGGLDVLEVAGLLGSLVDKSLVVAEQAGAGLRYRLLETIRLFAAERLVEARDDGEAAAVAAAHCAHFLSVAETAAPYLAGPAGQLAGPAGRRPGQPAARRRVRGWPPGRDRGGAAPGRRARPLLGGRSRLQETFGLLVPALQRPGAGADPALYVAALVTAARAANH